jgi:hypothetical protein
MNSVLQCLTHSFPLVASLQGEAVAARGVEGEEEEEGGEEEGGEEEGATAASAVRAEEVTEGSVTASTAKHASKLSSTSGGCGNKGCVAAAADECPPPLLAAFHAFCEQYCGPSMLDLSPAASSLRSILRRRQQQQREGEGEGEGEVYAVQQPYSSKGGSVSKGGGQGKSADTGGRHCKAQLVLSAVWIGYHRYRYIDRIWYYR